MLHCTNYCFMAVGLTQLEGFTGLLCPQLVCQAIIGCVCQSVHTAPISTALTNKSYKRKFNLGIKIFCHNNVKLILWVKFYAAVQFRKVVIFTEY